MRLMLARADEPTRAIDRARRDQMMRIERRTRRGCIRPACAGDHRALLHDVPGDSTGRVARRRVAEQSRRVAHFSDVAGGQGIAQRQPIDTEFHMIMRSDRSGQRDIVHEIERMTPIGNAPQIANIQRRHGIIDEAIGRPRVARQTPDAAPARPARPRRAARAIGTRT